LASQVVLGYFALSASEWAFVCDFLFFFLCIFAGLMVFQFL
jgi:hypothetical protein